MENRSFTSGFGACTPGKTLLCARKPFKRRLPSCVVRVHAGDEWQQCDVVQCDGVLPRCGLSGAEIAHEYRCKVYDKVARHQAKPILHRIHTTLSRGPVFGILLSMLVTIDFLVWRFLCLLFPAEVSRNGLLHACPAALSFLG